jgi:hypothetical protein
MGDFIGSPLFFVIMAALLIGLIILLVVLRTKGAAED